MSSKCRLPGSFWASVISSNRRLSRLRGSWLPGSVWAMSTPVAFDTTLLVPAASAGSQPSGPRSPWSPVRLAPRSQCPCSHYISYAHFLTLQLDHCTKMHMSGTKCISSTYVSTSSEEVVLELIRMKCTPVLLYGLEVLPLYQYQLRSLNFVVNRLFMKLFRTSQWWALVAKKVVKLNYFSN